MARKKGQVSRVLVGIMMLMLIVGLAGFGATNFGGQTQSVGTVGDTEIDINRYYRALNQELQALQAQTGQSLTLEQARQFGVDQVVIQRLIGAVALENEAHRIGLSVGDAEVQRQLIRTPAFAGLDGQFSRESYEFALSNAGITPADYENSIRSESATTMLQAAVSAGIAVPAGYGDILVGYVGERRNFSWLELTESSLDTPIPAPTETQLRTYFDSHGDDFMVPATKRLTYAWLSPDHLIDTVTVDENTLRALYDERSSEYNLPERRLVERLIFASSEDAAAAMARISSGEQSFQDVVAARGLTLDDIDMGDVTQTALGGAGDSVFALSEPGLVGPVETDLGPALFRVNAILAARETPFEDVRDSLRDELAADAARRAVADQIAAFDDLLAGGATLEDLAKETDMVLGQIDWWPENQADIAAYEGFAQAAAAVTPDDFPTITELEDGSVFALRLDDEIPTHPDSFENARDAVAEAWRTQTLDTALGDLATRLMSQLATGASLSSLGHPVQVETHATRDLFIEGAPASFVEQIFAAQPGDQVTANGTGRVVIARLDAVLEPDMDDPEVTRLQSALDLGISQSLGQDALDAFVRTLETQAGISLNQAAISAVHAQFPG